MRPGQLIPNKTVAVWTDCMSRRRTEDRSTLADRPQPSVLWARETTRDVSIMDLTPATASLADYRRCVHGVKSASHLIYV